MGWCEGEEGCPADCYLGMMGITVWCSVLGNTNLWL